MKYIIFTLLFCLNAGVVFGQTVIKTFENETVLPFVKIAIHSATDTNKQYLISDINGIATIENIKSDTTLFIQLTCIGFHDIVDTIQLNTVHAYQFIPSTKMIQEVCVTGEYTPTTSAEAINKITVIHKDDIIKSGASTLNDVLNYQTNIRIQQDNILGSALSLNGMSGENVKVLQDGVPMIGRLNGNIDLSQINLDNVERIEIVYGPLSVNYGTNALAGTINIITKKNGHSGWNGNVLGYYESIGNYNLSGQVSYRHKAHQFKLNGGRKYFDGWHKTEPFMDFPKETLADTNRWRQWKPKLQYFGELQYSTSINTWQINPYFRYYYEKIQNRGYPLKPYYETAFDDYYYTTRIDQGLNIKKQFKAANFNAIVAYNYFKRMKNTYFKDLTTLNEILTATASDQDTTTFDLLMTRATYSTQKSTWFNYQIGIDFNLESTLGKKIKDQVQAIGDYAIYSTAQMNFFKKKLVIKPGLRYAYNTTFESPLTPSINVKFSHKSFQFRSSVARGFRSPSLKELYFNFVDINHNIQGNTDLIPESSFNYNGNITLLKPVRSNDLLKLEAGYFYNDFSNLITLGLLADGSYTYINIGSFSTNGLQSAISYRSKSIRVQTNFTYTGRYNQVESETLPNFIYSPEVSTTVSYRIPHTPLTINGFYKFNGKLLRYTLYEDEISSSITSAYHILDLSLSSDLFKKKLGLIIGAKNLLNVRDLDVIGTTNTGAHSSQGNIAAARGTSVFISVNYKFKKYNQKQK